MAKITRLHASSTTPSEFDNFARETSFLVQEHLRALEMNAQERREHGIVYTPLSLARTLIELIFGEFDSSLGEPLTILDPACGTGNFLVEAFRRLLKARPYIKTPEQRIAALTASIFGSELDERALEVAKRRLWEVALEGGDRWIPFQEFPHSNLVKCDALSLVSANDPRRLLPDTGWQLELALIFQKRFDVVIGNPPYGKKRLSSLQRQYFAQSLYGHANTYGLFLHLGVELLKTHGFLGYVVPASMLSGLYFQNLREFLSKQCRIRAIVQFENREGIFKSVLQEVMLLVVQRGEPSGPYAVRVACVKDEAQLSDYSIFSRLVRKVPSEAVLRHSGGYGLIHVPTHEGADTIFQKYEERGLPLNDPKIGYVAKTGTIVWNRVKPLLSNDSDQDTRPLVWANNVGYYQFMPTGNRDGRFGYLRSNQQTQHLLAHDCCILVQRTTTKEQPRRLVAAFPKEWQLAAVSFFVENHLNMIVPFKAPAPVLPEYILALLNSTLFDFIFRTFNGSTQVSATELNVMRFVVPDSDVIGKASHLVSELQNGGAPLDYNRSLELVSTLDRIVYDLYGLTQIEIGVIEKHIRKAVS